jgi:hypothetical protein
MGSKIRIQLIAIVISIIFLLIPNYSMAESQNLANNESAVIVTYQDEPTTGLPSYIPVELNLKENNHLSPEINIPGNSDSSVVCPNGFVPAWWSIRKRRGSTEWRDVATFETPKVGKTLQATGVVKFNMWVTFLGSGSPGTSNFEFIWLRNEDRIASSTVNNVPLSNGMEPYLINTQGPLINQTPFEFGDVFKLKIRCQMSLDGARILYNSPEHNSHVMMTCDPLEVLEVHAGQNEIKGYYTDVFNVRFTHLTFVARINKLLVTQADPQFGMENIDNANFNFVSWAVKMEPGSYELEIGVSYVPNDNTSVVSQIKIIKIEPPKVPTWFGLPVWQAQIIITIIVLVVLAVILKTIYNKYQERKWIEETEN